MNALAYFETSAFDSQGLSELFNYVAKALLRTPSKPRTGRLRAVLSKGENSLRPWTEIVLFMCTLESTGLQKLGNSIKDACASSTTNIHTWARWDTQCIHTPSSHERTEEKERKCDSKSSSVLWLALYTLSEPTKRNIQDLRYGNE